MLQNLGLCSETEEILYAPEIEDRGYIVFVLFCKSALNFDLAYNFWKVSARALIFHTFSILRDKTFPWKHFLPRDFDLGLVFENLNLLNIIWIAKNRALIFHLNIPCDSFLLLLNLLTLTSDQLLRKNIIGHNF